MKFWKL